MGYPSQAGAPSLCPLSLFSSYYIFSYLFLKPMICFAGCLMSSASIQKLFCGIYSALKYFFYEFLREKVVSPSFFCHLSTELIFLKISLSSFQLLTHVWLFATPWIEARQASLSITISRSSLRLKSIKSMMPSSHLILCQPLLLLPPIPPSIRVFSNESTLCMR